jgi:enoyl-CoA hydratase/carnithine racemase
MPDREYVGRYRTARVEITDNGVLTLTLHSRGESLSWNARPHKELSELFGDIARDRGIRAVVITGTGDEFISMPPDFEHGLARGEITPAGWDQGLFEGVNLMTNYLAIPCPVVAAVNGPVSVHSELAVLADVVLCTPDTYFQDKAHFPSGLVPGDGVQVAWPLLLGPNRGRHFLLTGAKLSSEDALRLGVVAEVLPPQTLLARANEYANDWASMNPVLLRNTKHVLNRQLRRIMDEELQAGLALEAISSLSGKDWYAGGPEA